MALNFVEAPKGQLNIPQVITPAPTADLIGHEGVVVESRIPPQGVPEWKEFRKRGGGTEQSSYGYAARDGTETISPTSRDVIVPSPVDRDFLAYVKDMFALEPNIHAVDDLSRFSGETVAGIMDRYNGAGDTVHYGWWTMDELRPENQLLSPHAQRTANEKTFLRKIFDGNEKAFAGHVILRDPRVRSNATDGADTRSVYDITKGEFLDLQNGYERVWAKAGKWGLAGQGVTEVHSVEEIIRFYDQLVDLGIGDASVILERHLQGEGGSFTLIRRKDGQVLFNHVTKQLNVAGKRIGNIIHDIQKSPPEMVDLINLTARQLVNPQVVYPDKPGVYSFDTINDSDGNPVINDIAQRTTGTWTSAYQRLHLIRTLNLPPQDTVTWIGKLYLDPQSTFLNMMRALGTRHLTDFTNGGIVTPRQYFNGYGVNCVYYAITTTDEEQLPAIQKKVLDSLQSAGINYSPSTPL